MRVGELCGISVKDYSSDCGRIMVTGKGLKTRFVYLGKVSSQALWLYLLENYPSHKPILDDPLTSIVPIYMGGLPTRN
jgi:site-specific recombinase XerD